MNNFGVRTEIKAFVSSTIIIPFSQVNCIELEDNGYSIVYGPCNKVKHFTSKEQLEAYKRWLKEVK